MRGDDGLGKVGDGDVGWPLVHVRHGAAVELHVHEEVVDAGGEERRDEADDPQRGLGLLGGCIRRSLNLLSIYAKQFIKDAIQDPAWILCKLIQGPLVLD